MKTAGNPARMAEWLGLLKPNSAQLHSRQIPKRSAATPAGASFHGGPLGDLLLARRPAALPRPVDRRKQDERQSHHQPAHPPGPGPPDRARAPPRPGL